MNTKQRTTTKRNRATNNGETAEIPQPKGDTHEDRAICALERIAGSFERIAAAVEAIAVSDEEFNKGKKAELEVMREIRAEVRAGRPRYF